MRARLIVIAIIAGALAATAVTGEARNKSSQKSHSSHKGPKASGERGTFDYYVMALSWSPSFCETHPDEHEQCEHKGYGFVLHGLWPQYENGGGPENCPTTDEPDRKTVAKALAFMPNRSLVEHEWRAHGACTGLGPEDYFALADRAFAVVHVPQPFTTPATAVRTTTDDLNHAFTRANEHFDESMMSLHCSRGELVEVRVCLDKNLAPRACGKRMQSRCPATAEFVLPASK
jgi:ribonuclease T2